MAPLAATNVAHAAVTDHRILRRPGSQAAPPKTAGSPPVPVVWHNPEPPLDQRNLGLAYLEFAHERHLVSLAEEAARMLASLPSALLDDPSVLTALGDLTLQEHRPQDALKLFAKAAQEQPQEAADVFDEAVAYEAEGDESGAIQALERAVQLDPSLQRAYFELARLYEMLGQPAARLQALRPYVQRFPESVKGRLELNGEDASPPVH